MSVNIATVDAARNEYHNKIIETIVDITESGKADKILDELEQLASVITEAYDIHLEHGGTLDDDGTMFDDYFIAGITTPSGEYTYHQHMDYWDKFDVEERERAPEWDGHKPEDITRLYGLLD